MAETALIRANDFYSVIPVEAAKDAQAAAERIRELHKHTALASIEIGRELLAVRERLGHGEFGKWLAAEFSWSDRTARNYMQVAEQFGDKTEIVSSLPATTLYALASPSTPEAVRHRVVARLSAGEMRPDDAASAVREGRREAADKRRRDDAKKRRAKALPADLKRIEAQERREVRETEKRNEARARREIMEDKLVALLRTRLTDTERDWLFEAVADLDPYQGALTRVAHRLVNHVPIRTAP